MLVANVVRPSSSRTAVIRCSVWVSRVWSTSQSASTMATRSNAAGPVGDQPGRVGERGEEVAGDPQRRLLPAAAGDLAAHGALEPGPPQPAGAVQLATVTVGDHGHRRGPGAGLERLRRGAQGGRPHALEEVADLLDLGGGLGEQLVPARAQVP